jgi:hypothetical protein
MKKQISFKQIPIGVGIIAAFYIFGAFMLLASIYFNPLGISQAIDRAHGLSTGIGIEILVIVSGLALVLAYGLIRVSRWGYLLTIAYSLYLLVVSLVMGGLSFLWTGSPAQQVFFGSLLWSMIVVVYLLFVRRRFFPKTIA